MKNKCLYLHCWLLLLLVPLLFTSALKADDAEIYYSQSDRANPNVLFVLDNSGSMNTVVPDSGGKTRMKVMQEAFSAMLDTAPTNLNIGLMRYGGHTENKANGVSFPVKPVDLDKEGNGDAKTIITDRISLSQDNLPDPAEHQPVREFLKQVANGWTVSGYTPIVDALYEAARYYRGEPADQGKLLPDKTRAAHPSTYQGKLEWNEKAACETPYDCMKVYCGAYMIPDTCEIKPLTTCDWGTISPTGACCQSVATTDEAGNATSYTCKDNNYTCPVEGCVTYTEKNIEICKAQQCKGAATNDVDYISPIQHACQANYIVLMSDGRPEYSSGTNALPPSLANVNNMTGKPCQDSPHGYKSGTCGAELTHFLSNTDQSAVIDGKQTVNTFTVAFGLDDPDGTAYLTSLANMSGGALAANDASGLQTAFGQIIQRISQPAQTEMVSADPAYYRFSGTKPLTIASVGLFTRVFGWLGAGIENVENHSGLALLFSPLESLHHLALANSGAFTASNLQDLTDTFNNILDKIDASASSFSSPSYQVDKNNLLKHSDEVFIPVFERSMLPVWSGNLKKFKLKNGSIVGKDNQPAVDKYGTFTADAWDFWGNSASGKDVKSGGAASKLPSPSARKLYTDAIEGSMGNLKEDNTAITITQLYKDGDDDNGHGNNSTGCDPDNPNAGTFQACADYRAKLINFIRGTGKNGQPRQHIGDIMNSKPLILDYTDATYVLVGSNEGFLHVLDASTGVEQWAFMPRSLLKNTPLFYDNTQARQHVYGIDGVLTPWLVDKNDNGKIDSADGDKALLFFGMRRGGREYYALDISDMTSPKITWHISNTTSGFSELGETWSKPAFAKLRVKNSSGNILLKDVLVFGAGFDPALEEENPVTRVADTQGRDVFIVDAGTGDLLWSLRQQVAGAADMLDHSIPADIRVLDMDRNGALDRLYFADTGGSLWRVDMDMDVRDTDASLYDYTDAKLTLLADFGGNGTDKRKFYYEPDVALMKKDNQTVMTIAIGSGYRSHPQNTTIADRFYVLKDENVYTQPDTNIALKDVDLSEADSMSANGGNLLDGTTKGWYIDLPNTGEKVLAPASTLFNKVVFSTFANDTETGVDPCDKPSNTARAYALDLYSGQAVANLDRSADDSLDKSVVAGLNEILGEAQTLFLEPTAADGSTCTATDCQQNVTIRIGKMELPIMDTENAPGLDIGNILPRIFWRDNSVSNP